jgi:hypothetical protein
MQKRSVMASVTTFVALVGTMMATAPAGAQGVPGGPGCHLLMNQAACVACVKKHLPQIYDPKGSAQWCAARIGERRAKGLGPEPLARGPNRISHSRAKSEGAQTVGRESCLAQCVARGSDRTKAGCSPWCEAGRCYRSLQGTPYCVQ